ncbi:PREDICTED: zinc finger protein 165 [Nicrophorus vespilloides]|uniref:Zinc finger protein 165 n=1 Tax=Nicrophorus vespilloides TaxID=110193 RepID=A0ABM1MFE3_NICVS|nr:PREDICTED: zinc finger protein 165 [Nicrophorus vespilloides]
MDEIKDDDANSDHQEVTVEVIPDTVGDIIYLQDSIKCEPMLPSDDEDNENEEQTEYEIGSVDASKLRSRDLVLDQSETFVLLSGSNGLLHNDTVKLEGVKEEPGLFQYECGMCHMKTDTLASLQQHNSIHDSEICLKCNKEYPKEEIYKHYKREHLEITCETCNWIIIGQRNYASHVRQHDYRKYVCSTCSAIFTNGKKLMKHMETHGTVLLYACNKCGEPFSSTQEVTSHLRQVHGGRRC